MIYTFAFKVLKTIYVLNITFAFKVPKTEYRYPRITRYSYIRKICRVMRIRIIVEILMYLNEN